MRLSDNELDSLFRCGSVTDGRSILSNDGNDRLLPDGFEPSSYDVICGRGKGSAQWEGNRRFQVIIAMNQEKYLKAPERKDKSKLLDSIVRTVRDLRPRAGFVRQDPATGRWYEIGDHQARRKVGHAIRDATSAHKKKTKQSKKRTAKSKEAIAEKVSRTKRVSRMVSISSNEETPEALPASASVTKDFSTLFDELEVVLGSADDNRTISPLFWETLNYPLSLP